jgi:hypothetical protein
LPRSHPTGVAASRSTPGCRTSLSRCLEREAAVCDSRRGWAVPCRCLKACEAAVCDSRRGLAVPCRCLEACEAAVCDSRRGWAVPCRCLKVCEAAVCDSRVGRGAMWRAGTGRCGPVARGRSGSRARRGCFAHPHFPPRTPPLRSTEGAIGASTGNSAGCFRPEGLDVGNRTLLIMVTTPTSLHHL